MEPITLPRLLAHNPLRGRDLLSIADLTLEEARLIIAAARKLKARQHISPVEDEFRKALYAKHLALLFEKPSLRTRVTLQLAMEQLGGTAIYLGPEEVMMGSRESVPDIARNLDRWVHAIAARVYRHQHLEILARYAQIPVINALSDLEHPCQVLADFMTLEEYKGEPSKIQLAWVGDGNNVCHSLILISALYGTHLRVACPSGYEPLPEVVTRAQELAQASGAVIEILQDPRSAVMGADAVYTDVWISMGQEEEAEERRRDLAGYQVNSQLVTYAKPDAIIMHCLPAHRGEEITDEMIDGPQSVVLDQAENRLYVQKALLLFLLSGQPTSLGRQTL